MTPSTFTDNKKRNSDIALCGLLTALGVVLMMLGGMVPVFTYCSPLLSSMILIAVLSECGKWYAWMVYTATAILSFFLSADKEAAVFYMFFGYYPILKLSFERIKGKVLKSGVKVCFFGTVVFLMYWLLLKLFKMEALLEDFKGAGTAVYIGMWAAMVLIMLLYDKCLNSMAYLYIKKVRPVIRKIKF